MNPEEYFSKLEEIFIANGQSFKLNKPATKSEISNFEQLTQSELNPNLKSFWQYANGCEYESNVFFTSTSKSSFFTCRFIDIAEAIENYHYRSDLNNEIKYAEYSCDELRDKRIKPCWFNKKWVPFADFGNSIFEVSVDNDPSEHGDLGQIIAYLHDPDNIHYISKNFEVFLKDSINLILKYPEDFFLQ